MPTMPPSLLSSPAFLFLRPTKTTTPIVARCHCLHSSSSPVTTAIAMRAGGVTFLPLLAGVVALGPDAPRRCCSAWVVAPPLSSSSAAPAWRGGYAARRDDHRVLLPPHHRVRRRRRRRRRADAPTALSADAAAPATPTGGDGYVNGDAVASGRSATTLRTMPPLSLSIPLSSSSSSSTSSSFSSYCDEHLPLARDMMDYIDASPDPFHAVKNAVAALEGEGFVEWRDDGGVGDGDGDGGTLRPGGRYYFTRNRSALVAFTVGSRYGGVGGGGGGFKIIGSHTDSPNLKVKPNSRRSNGGSSGTMQIAVECYGGGLWNTWFDRDLGVSGRVFIRDDDCGKGGRIRQVSAKAGEGGSPLRFSSPLFE